MAAAPTHLRIRALNTGFGECLHLTFTYAAGRPRNVLIDFGSTKASRFGPARGMTAIAEKIRDECQAANGNGKLDMLVATHRHADHISGFAGESGAIIRALDPALVVQPWTEDPTLDPNAAAPARAAGGGGHGLRARAHVARLSEMQSLAQAVLDEVPRLRATKGVSNTLVEQLSFLGDTNISNREAVENLMTMGKRRIYARFGTRLPISSVLPGVKIDVIGPPTLAQAPAIIDPAEVDADEFWHVAARRASAVRAARGGVERIFPNAPVARSYPQEARWVIPQIDKMRAEEMLAIVRSLDDALNNTSLILLFKIAGKVLVFPGDAQLENWRYALRENDRSDAIRADLARASFYKVGHHGSLNATPKSLLWQNFARRSATAGPDRLATLVSTLSGKHGSVARRTEVPRRALIDELTRMSDLSNTQTLRSRKQFWVDVEIDL
jgi:hypothetical protein